MRPVARLGLVIVALAGVVGCETARPPVAVQSVVETRWLLIRNPSVSDLRIEPEYVWVEEDRVPAAMLMRGKYVIIPTPDVVAKYGPPPGEGKISPRQTNRFVIHPVTGEILGVLDPER